jgi:hypothetical protein
VDGSPVGCQQEVVLSGVGTYTLTLTITDLCGNTDSEDATVTVQNQPPVALCKPYAANADPINCCITVNLSDIDNGSNDPDGESDIVSLCITAVDGVPVGCEESVEICGNGVHPVTITITDVCGETSSCDAPVNVIDITPPVMTIDLDRDVLWPPNHKYADVNTTVEVTDNCDPNPTFVLTDAKSDEPDNGHGDGNTVNDIVVVTATAFQLRSERAGGGDGRCYTLIYTASDASGNTTVDSVCVRVPHDQSGHAVASMGFNADGTGFDPSFERFVVVIPSNPGRFAMDVDGNLITLEERFDATKLDIDEIYVGNTKGALRPEQSLLIDVNGDLCRDLALYYPIDATLELDPAAPLGPDNDRKMSRRSDGPVGLHYRDTDGTDRLVSNICELGAPVPLLPTMPPMIVDEFDDGAPDETSRAVPEATEIASIYPNPFNPTTTVSISLVSETKVSLRVYDVRGTLVRTLKDESMPAGVHEVRWDGRDASGVTVATGIYFVRFMAGNHNETRKMVLLK